MENRFLADQIQEILNRNTDPAVAVHEIGRFISIFHNKVYKDRRTQLIKEAISQTVPLSWISYSYYITSPRVDGKLIVPEHEDIPKEFWGKQVMDRHIKWEAYETNS